jgi:hypothetical protein
MLSTFDTLFRRYLTTLLTIYVLVGLVVLIALVLAAVAFVRAYAEVPRKTRDCLSGNPLPRSCNTGCRTGRDQ